MTDLSTPKTMAGTHKTHPSYHLMVQKSGEKTHRLDGFESLYEHMGKTAISTGDRWISEPSTVFQIQGGFWYTLTETNSTCH